MNENLEKGSYLDSLLRSPQTIFSTKDIAILWRETDSQTITNRLKKYVTSGKLIRVHRGFYAKDKNYNRYELATRIYTPAYISFETVLTAAGVVFQHYESIYVASYVSRIITIDTTTINLVRIKPALLYTTFGLESREGYTIASPERAFLDRFYHTPHYHFDNVDVLDWDAVATLLPYYNNQRLTRAVQDLKEQTL